MSLYLSPASKARLLREMSMLSKDPPPGVAAYAPWPSDVTKIRAQITGPEGSPFEGGIFLLTVNIAGRYPFEPPRCRFITPLYHPNIDSGGRICLDTLKSPPAGSWSPAVSLPSLLLSIRSLMAEPNPDDGLVPEISELYKRNPSEWKREARTKTRMQATMEKLVEVESSLDGGAAHNQNKDAIANETTEIEGVQNGNSRGIDGPSMISSKEENASAIVSQNGRVAKRSKLASRK